MKLSARHRSHSDPASLRFNYVTIDGTISLTDLIAWATERGIPFEDLNLNWATIRWTEEPTPEEIEADKVEIERVRANRESWERKTLAELKAKYE